MLSNQYIDPDTEKKVSGEIENIAGEAAEAAEAAEKAADNAAETVEKTVDSAAETAENTVEAASDAVKETAEEAADEAAKAAEDVNEEAEKAQEEIDEELAKAKAANDKAQAKLQKRLDRVDKKFSLKNVLKVLIPLLVIGIIVFVILKVAFGNPKDINFGTDGFVSSDPSPVDTSKGINGQLLSDSGMTLFADNGRLSLSYSPRDDLFIIQDKTTGRVFRSYPEPIYADTVDENGDPVESDLALYGAKTETGQILTSPVFIEYTKSGMEGGFTKGINQMTDLVKAVYYIENGVQLIYDVGDLELSFVVEITIEDNALVYRVPMNGIKERETLEGEEDDRRPFLCALSVLPYLGAHRNGETGYFVSPDGSGALTYFDVSRVSNYSEYSKRIYGFDPTYDMLDSPDYSNENLTMAVYGIVDDEYMITSFIDTGDANAELKIGNPGVKSLPFYSIYFEFTYRYFYRMQITKGGELFEMVTRDPQIGSFEQHVYFDAKTDFTPDENHETAYTYVDVASKTRELLLDKWSREWGIEKAAITEPSSPLSIRFFMGAETTSGGLLNQLKVMTTFDDVKSIYGELEEAGAADLRLMLLGWTRDGYYWNNTTRNKVESDFGGKKGLKSLNVWAKDKGLELSLDNNLLILYGNPKNGANSRNSVVKRPSTYYMQYFQNTTSGRLKYNGYYMSPVYFNNKLMKKQISNLKKYGTSNVTLQQVGDLLYTDYNEKNALTRTQAREMYVEWIKKYKSEFDSVSVYYGSEFAAAIADTVDNIPMDKSSSILLDAQIPFVQLVYHGIVEYYTSPINKQDRPDYSRLKAIEYGACMSYEVTDKEAKLLQYTDYVTLFKGEFSLLKDEIVESYKMANEAIVPFSTQTITNHYKVSDIKEVYCTEYSGGAKVYVNYTDADYVLPDGSTVGTMNYLVIGG